MNSLKELKNKKVFFIGIGGISMSALAQILFGEKIEVIGSDLSENDEVKKLRKKNIKVFSSHRKENVYGCQVVVYSSAVDDDNAELVFAKQNNLILLKRAELLAIIANSYKYVISVAGSHGKTTATAMICEIFARAKLNPTCHIGGEMNYFGSNYHIGNKKYFITESCEYKDNFLKIKANLAVILNIDADHLDYFKTIDCVKDSFFKFSQNLRDGGICITNYDDENSREIIDNEDVVCFGCKGGDVVAKNIKISGDGKSQFDCYFCGEKLGKIKLNIEGKHNIYNALCAIYVSLCFGVDYEYIKFALENFKGTKRRSQWLKNINGAKVLFDYAHHPSQIRQMINLAGNIRYKKLIVVFEPHTFSRTKYLLDGFAYELARADDIILAPVYSAREVESDGYNSFDLLEKIKEKNVNVSLIYEYENIISKLKTSAKEGDMVLILGAGSIENLAKILDKNN